MASSRDNFSRFQLPDVIDPPDTLCFTIRVPNDRWHLAAFYGALFDLTLWINWYHDGTHAATDTAKVWKRIWQALAPSSCEVPPAIGGGGVGVDLMIRQNPDNPCLLETSIDGTNWCVFADLSKCANFGTQPGPGSPQPPPGGGNADYCTTLDARGHLLVPTPVSTGDVIELTSCEGSGTDSASPLSEWYCCDGSQMFGGTCYGSFKHTVSTDPLNTAPHMTILANFGGTYVDLGAGSPVTVPSGVSGVQPTLQVNDSDLTDNSGSYTLCVKVTNNATAHWTHDFDFTSSDYASDWSVISDSNWVGPTGQYVIGAGYRSTYNPHSVGVHSDRIVRILAAHACNLTAITVRFTFTAGAQDCSVDSEELYIADHGVSFISQVLCPTIPTSPYVATASGSPVTLEIGLIPGSSNSATDPGGVATITSIHLEGTGTDPF